MQRIRYSGYLCNRRRSTKLAQCRELLSMAQAKAILRSGAKEDYRGLYETLTGKSLTLCPVCAIGHAHQRNLAEAERAPMAWSRHDRSIAPGLQSQTGSFRRGGRELLPRSSATRGAEQT